MATQQRSSWPMISFGKQTTIVEQQEDRDEHADKEGACTNCCCCCSLPALAGFLIGALLAGTVLATVLTLYLRDQGKTSSTSTTTRMIFLGPTTFQTILSTTSATTTTMTTSSSTASTVSTASTSVTTSVTRSTTTSSTSTSTTTTAPWCTTLVTFNDIPGQLPVSGVIPNGYNSLNWTNARYVNTSTIPISGYPIASTSPPYVADNPTGGPLSLTSANGTSFAFNSLVVAAGWRDYLQWTISGYRLGTLMIQGTFSLQTVNRTTITCGSCTNLDTLTLTSAAGSPRSGLAQNGTQFVLDDLCVSFGY